MEMSQIRYFIAVSETLNFTRAAERCCISQPALTKGIQKLENLIGGSLFVRSKNCVELTELGKTLLPNFVEIYTSAKEAQARAKRVLDRDHSIIRLGVQSNIGFELVSHQVARYRDSGKAVDIQFVEGTKKELLEKLKVFELDVVFLSEIQRDQDSHDNTLYHEPLVVVGEASHPLMRNNEITLADLDSLPFCYRQNCEASDYFVNLLSCLDVEPKIVMESASLDSVVQFVKMGFGICVLPQSLAEHAKLSYRAVSDCPVQRRVFLTSNAAKAKSPEIRHFCQTLATDSEQLAVA